MLGIETEVGLRPAGVAGEDVVALVPGEGLMLDGGYEFSESAVATYARSALIHAVVADLFFWQLRLPSTADAGLLSSGENPRVRGASVAN